MTRKLDRISGLTLCLLAMALGCVAIAKDNFVAVRLPKDVQVLLPSNWVVLSGQARTTLDAAAQALSETAGIVDATSDLAFAANLYGDDGKTIGMFNIRYYPDLDIGQPDVAELTSDDVLVFDSALKDQMIATMAEAQSPIRDWWGTQKFELTNGRIALLTEYRRASPGSGSTFRVQLVRVLNKDNSFTVTLSRREDLEVLLRPICGKILRSINFP